MSEFNAVLEVPPPLQSSGGSIRGFSFLHFVLFLSKNIFKLACPRCHKQIFPNRIFVAESRNINFSDVRQKLTEPEIMEDDEKN